MKKTTKDVYVTVPQFILQIVTSIVIAIGVITMIIGFVALGAACNAEAKKVEVKTTEYTVRAEVVNADTKTNTVNCENVNGEVWQFYGAEEFQEGDFVILLMDTKNTNIIYDDEVLSVRLDPFAY